MMDLTEDIINAFQNLQRNILNHFEIQFFELQTVLSDMKETTELWEFSSEQRTETEADQPTIAAEERVTLFVFKKEGKIFKKEVRKTDLYCEKEVQVGEKEMCPNSMGEFAKQRSKKARLKGKQNDYRSDIAWLQRQNMMSPPNERENSLIGFHRWHFKTSKKGANLILGL